jgi:hypothetical protein
MDDEEKDIEEFAEDVADFFDEDFDPHDEFFNDWEGR